MNLFIVLKFEFMYNKLQILNIFNAFETRVNYNIGYTKFVIDNFNINCNIIIIIINVTK